MLCFSVSSVVAMFYQLFFKFWLICLKALMDVHRARVLSQHLGGTTARPSSLCNLTITYLRQCERAMQPVSQFWRVSQFCIQILEGQRHHRNFATEQQSSNISAWACVACYQLYRNRGISSHSQKHLSVQFARPANHLSLLWCPEDVALPGDDHNYPWWSFNK